MRFFLKTQKKALTGAVWFFRHHSWILWSKICWVINFEGWNSFLSEHILSEREKKMQFVWDSRFHKKSWNSVEIIDFLIRIFFLKLYMNSMAENIYVCQISCKNSIGNKSYEWKCSGRVTFFLSPQRHEANFEGRIDFLGVRIWHQIPKLRCIG